LNAFSNSDPSIKTNSKLYYDYGRRLAKSCTVRNFVADRRVHDNVGLSFETNRTWTLSADAYYSNDAMPFCSSTSSLLDSLRHGRRQFVSLDADLNYFDKQPPESVFVPHGCRYAWYSPPQCCEVLQRFERVLFVGDSLARHLLLGARIVLSGNFEYGGLPSLSSRTQYDDCRCDGQFSEHPWCRVTPEFNDNRDVGFCNSQTTFHFRFLSAWQPVEKGSLGSLCNAVDTRPTVAVLSGGLHFGVDATQTLSAMLTPVVEDLRSQCRDVKIVWMTLGNQHKKLDLQFPHQSGAATLAFNARLSD
jgi:hypothetical protein